jgi:peptide subunit release factor 1 (eRF1)
MNYGLEEARVRVQCPSCDTQYKFWQRRQREKHNCPSCNAVHEVRIDCFAFDKSSTGESDE